MPAKKHDTPSVGDIRRFKGEVRGIRKSCRHKGFDHHQSYDSTTGAEYTDDEVEFAMAMDAYKRRTQRRFPNWIEVHRVLKELGYRKEPVRINGEGTGASEFRDVENKIKAGG